MLSDFSAVSCDDFLRNKVKCALVAVAFTLPVLMSVGTQAQSLGDQVNPYAPDNAPNQVSLDCLKAPTADCAIQAAFQAVIDEQLAGEKARVLTGVAEALISGGDTERAKQTLLLAMNEARASGLSIIYQEKLQAIAPLMVRVGDPASALAIAADARYGNIRDRVLASVAREAAIAGQIDTLRVATAQLSNKKRAFWEELNLLSRAPAMSLSGVDVQSYVEEVAKFQRADFEYRGIILSAIIAFKQGDEKLANKLISSADDVFERIVSNAVKMDLASLRVEAMYEAGMPPQFQAASYDLATEVETNLVQGQERWRFTNRLAGYEASNSNLEIALERAEVFDALDKRANFMGRLVNQDTAFTSEQRSALQNGYVSVLNELAVLETAFERDQARLSMLKGAVANNFSDAALTIVGAMEDDDSQALGLALLSPILE